MLHLGPIGMFLGMLLSRGRDTVDFTNDILNNVVSLSGDAHQAKVAQDIFRQEIRYERALQIREDIREMNKVMLESVTSYLFLGSIVLGTCFVTIIEGFPPLESSRIVMAWWLLFAVWSITFTLIAIWLALSFQVKISAAARERLLRRYRYRLTDDAIVGRMGGQNIVNTFFKFNSMIANAVASYAVTAPGEEDPLPAESVPEAALRVKVRSLDSDIPLDAAPLRKGLNAWMHSSGIGYARPTIIDVPAFLIGETLIRSTWEFQGEKPLLLRVYGQATLYIAAQSPALGGGMEDGMTAGATIDGLRKAIGAEIHEWTENERPVLTAGFHAAWKGPSGYGELQRVDGASIFVSANHIEVPIYKIVLASPREWNGGYIDVVVCWKFQERCESLLIVLRKGQVHCKEEDWPMAEFNEEIRQIIPFQDYSGFYLRRGITYLIANVVCAYVTRIWIAGERPMWWLESVLMILVLCPALAIVHLLPINMKATQMALSMPVVNRVHPLQSIERDANGSVGEIFSQTKAIDPKTRRDLSYRRELGRFSYVSPGELAVSRSANSRHGTSSGSRALPSVSEEDAQDNNDGVRSHVRDEAHFDAASMELGSQVADTPPLLPRVSGAGIADGPDSPTITALGASVGSSPPSRLALPCCSSPQQGNEGREAVNASLTQLRPADGGMCCAPPQRAVPQQPVVVRAPPVEDHFPYDSQAQSIQTHEQTPDVRVQNGGARHGWFSDTCFSIRNYFRGQTDLARGTPALFMLKNITRILDLCFICSCLILIASPIMDWFRAPAPLGASSVPHAASAERRLLLSRMGAESFGVLDWTAWEILWPPFFRPTAMTVGDGVLHVAAGSVLWTIRCDSSVLLACRAEKPFVLPIEARGLSFSQGGLMAIGDESIHEIHRTAVQPDTPAQLSAAELAAGGLLDLAYAATGASTSASALFLRHELAPVGAAALADLVEDVQNPSVIPAVVVVIASPGEATARFCVVTTANISSQDITGSSSAQGSQRQLKVLAHVSAGGSPLGNISAVYVSAGVDGELVLWTATEHGMRAYGLTSGRPLVFVDLPPPTTHGVPHFGQPLPDHSLHGQPHRGLAQERRPGLRGAAFPGSRIISLAGNATHLFALVAAEDQRPVVLSAPFLSLLDSSAGKEL